METVNRSWRQRREDIIGRGLQVVHRRPSSPIFVVPMSFDKTLTSITMFSVHISLPFPAYFPVLLLLPNPIIMFPSFPSRKSAKFFFRRRCISWTRLAPCTHSVPPRHKRGWFPAAEHRPFPRPENETNGCPHKNDNCPTPRGGSFLTYSTRSSGWRRSTVGEVDRIFLGLVPQFRSLTHVLLNPNRPPLDKKSNGLKGTPRYSRPKNGLFSTNLD